MSDAADRAALASAAKALAGAWADVKGTWRDAKAREFEERFLAPIFDAMRTTAPAIDELQEILYQIKKDCE